MLGEVSHSHPKHGTMVSALLPPLVVLMVGVAACAGSDPTAESTAVAGAAITEPEVSTTDPATAETAPPEAAVSPTTSSLSTTSAPPPEPSDTGTPGVIGYHVVGVAADDVLNVRAGPSAQDAIVGRLAPGAVGVVVTDTWDDPWWRVILTDGTEGFVNSGFLAVDDAWTAPFSELPCADDSVDWTLPQVSPEPAQISDAEFVYGYDYLTSRECDRLVIRLAARPAVLTANASNWHASIAAATLPGGIDVTSESNRVIITFPDDYFEVRSEAAHADFSEAELYVVSPLADRAKRAVELVHSSERIAYARFLDDPARIVVDVKPDPDPSGIDYSPIARGVFVLTEPALWDGTIPGTDQPITITGFGRPYEGWAWVSLSRLNGDGAVDALWLGATNCDGDGDSARGDSYCFTATWEVWGEFSFTIDELPPGAYRLSMQDECASGDEVACAEFVLHHDFTIGS